MRFKKYSFLFFILAVFVLVLLPLKTSVAVITDSGCERSSTVYYQTGCGLSEKFSVGTCSSGHCCSQHEECEETCDEEGNCTESCHNVCDDRCWRCSCSGSWYEYSSTCGDSSSCKCGTGEECCDGDILRREGYSYKDGRCRMGSCDNEKCCVDYRDQDTCEECGSWQKPLREGACDGDCTEWGLTKPECQCCGECIDPPENPKYYMDPSGSIEAEANNVYLPVKLDWDDVPGWIGGYGGSFGVNCSSGGKVCYDSSSAAREASADYDKCVDECLYACYQRAKEEHPTCTCHCLLMQYASPCRRTCEVFWAGADAVCAPYVPTYAAGADPEECTADCPALEGNNTCYSPDAFVRSYVIEIYGKTDIDKIRDCDTLISIANLEDLIDQETDVSKVYEYIDEIKAIREEGLYVEGSYVAVLNESEFIPPCECMFQSGRAYNWHVKACCGEDGTGCGPWSEEWSFTANPAPEPKWPYDPDWAGPGAAENLSLAESNTLKWCEINDSERYPLRVNQGFDWYSPPSDKILIYYLNQETNEYQCHPNLEIQGECSARLLSPTSESKPRLPSPEVIHPFEFYDTNNAYFTKLNSYSWKVQACEGSLGYNPTDYSQEWKFSVGNFILPVPKVNIPPDNKIIPVGLPRLLKWQSPYAHSWNYVVSGGGKTFTGGIDVNNIGFDYPDLTLNTVYSWQVQPCWDYKSTECATDWGGPWYFKITGQPPQLIYPENNATQVVVPITLKWEEVGGAKSYVFKINGEEKIVEEGAEITIDYPELLQETPYSWQVKTCAKDKGELCGEWSGSYQFTTFKLGAPINPQPKNGSTISTTELRSFSWDEIEEARAYQFQIEYRTASSVETRKDCLERVGETATKTVPGNSFYYPLECNGAYQWQVNGCLAEDCEPQSIGEQGDFWAFELVSQSVTQEVSTEILSDTLENTIYPQVFKNIPGEAADRVKEIVSEKTLEILTNYPEEQWLSVAAATPEVPEEILEEVLNEGIEDPVEIANQVGQRAAEKTEEITQPMPENLLEGMLEKLPEETLKISDASEVSAMIEEIFNEEWEEESNKTVAQASTSPEVPATVLGQVLTAMQEEILEETLRIVNEAMAAVSKEIGQRKGGLVPCGRTANNPDTPWDETSSCGVDDIFIMLKIIIDFLLFKLAPIALILLMVASGVMFYFSIKIDATDPLVKIKSLWRTAGIGFGILLFSWLIISFIFASLGYQFGPWWSI